MDQVKKYGTRYFYSTRNQRGKANYVTKDRVASGEVQVQTQRPPANKHQRSPQPHREAGNGKNPAPAVIAVYGTRYFYSTRNQRGKANNVTKDRVPSGEVQVQTQRPPANKPQPSRQPHRKAGNGKNPAPAVIAKPVSTVVASTSTGPLSHYDYMWRAMSQNERKYRHSPFLLRKHHDISPRHRAMTLVWLMRICEAQQFRKETYFTACDILDRFLFYAREIGLLELQLVAISALSIAKKSSTLRTWDYSMMADGIYSASDIKKCKQTIFKVLRRKTTPVTCITWGSFYLQNELLVTSEKADEKMEKSKLLFIHASRLLNLSMLDSKSLTFKYSTLAACAFYFAHPQPKKIVDILLPRLNGDEFFECLRWMVNFHEVLSDPELPIKDEELKDCHVV